MNYSFPHSPMYYLLLLTLKCYLFFFGWTRDICSLPKDHVNPFNDPFPAFWLSLPSGRPLVATVLLQDWSRVSGGARARSPPPLSAASAVLWGRLATAWASQPIKKYHKVSLQLFCLKVKHFQLNCIRLYIPYFRTLVWHVGKFSTFRYYWQPSK